MKKTKTILFAFIISAGFANAATYAVTNGTGATANGITNSSEVPYVGTGGVVAIGTFGTTADFTALTNPTDFVSAFNQFGGSGNFLTAGIFGNAGIFSLSTAGTVAGTAFAGAPIHLLVGNSDEFGTATEFLVLELNRNFLSVDDDSGTPIDLTFTAAASTILWGSPVDDVRTTTADASVTPGFASAVPVPEPSVALLGAFGILGLLRRRR